MSQPRATVCGVGSRRGVGGATVEHYWLLHRQPKSAWPQALDLRPAKEIR